MTAYDKNLRRPEFAAFPPFAEAPRIMRSLARATLFYFLLTAIFLALFTVAPIPEAFQAAPAAFGLPGVVIGSLLIATLGLATCLLVVWGRRQDAQDRRAGRWIGARGTVTWAAGWPQATLILILAGCAALALGFFWPQHVPAAPALNPQGWFGVAGALLVAVFPCLITERFYAAVPAEWLPESGALRSLLLLPVVALLAEAAFAAAAGLGIEWTYWLRIALGVALLAVAAELAVRTATVWFLPPPETQRARAAVSSLLAGALRIRSVSPGALGEAVRSQFGIDFSRSWALAYLRAALAPVVLLLLAFCWFLSGVTRIELNERGSYERLGAPTAILKPGLHLLLPWPFGVVRHLELGVVHSVSLSDGAAGAPPEPDTSTAEADPSPAANRLWDSEQPADVSYIIANDSAGRQSFQTVSVNLRVLFRVGMDDAAARSATYRMEQPETIVRTLSGRVLAQFFATQTLTGVLEEDRADMSHRLKASLQEELDHLQSGVEIVAVVIEAIHPPSGAAAAYRSVQAAQIEAATQIAAERGRAETTSNLAQRDAHAATNDAGAEAAETVSAAHAELTDLEADEKSYRTSERPFLLERTFANLRQALAKSPLEIIDHRLAGANLPTLDLRPQPGHDGTDEGDHP
jgi:regulator of protease activity HflC (stomatin/prohibitin superfamily)